MSGVKILHFLKDWWKSIPIHQNYTMALKFFSLQNTQGKWVNYNRNKNLPQLIFIDFFFLGGGWHLPINTNYFNLSQVFQCNPVLIHLSLAWISSWLLKDWMVPLFLLSHQNLPNFGVVLWYIYSKESTL